MCRSGVGTFAPQGYRHPQYPYSVKYDDAAAQRLMPEQWQLDNFFDDRGALRPKQGADYESTLYLDTDGNGENDDLGKHQIFDLRFTHRKTAGVIWVRTIPLVLSMRDKELSVLLDGMVESISGGGYRVVQLAGNLYAANKQQVYAAKVVHRSPASLAGLDAYMVTVDVSNVDRLRVDPKSVEARMMLVLARTPFEFEHPGWNTKFPVTLFLGYSNSRSDFRASLRDFAGLLNRLEISGNSGFELPPREEPSEAIDAAVPLRSAPVDAGALTDASDASD